MSYIKATQVLPEALLRQVQQYIDGEFLYIPRIPGTEKDWGTDTSTRKELRERNEQIYEKYLSGSSMEHLADTYYLSLKSIQRIIRQMKS